MKQTRLMKMLFVPAALSFFAACSAAKNPLKMGDA